MKNFETNGNRDTVLTGGLIAIAIAWVAFSAFQAPAANGAIRANAALSAAARAASAPASISARAGTAAAGHEPGVVGKVS